MQIYESWGGNFPATTFQTFRTEPQSPFEAAFSTLPDLTLNIHLGSYCLRNCTPGKLHTWEIATYEVALGKKPLSKYLTPIVISTYSFQFISSILSSIIIMAVFDFYFHADFGDPFYGFEVNYFYFKKTNLI